MLTINDQLSSNCNFERSIFGKALPLTTTVNGGRQGMLSDLGLLEHLIKRLYYANRSTSCMYYPDKNTHGNSSSSFIKHQTPERASANASECSICSPIGESASAGGRMVEYDGED